MKNALEIVKDTSIVMLSITMAFVLTRLDLSSQETQPAPLDTLKAGEKIECFAGYLGANTPQHLIIVVSPNCNFCIESMPFYKQLVDAGDNASHLQVHFAVDNQVDDYEPILAILKEANISADVSIIPVDRNACELLYSPTMLLLNKHADIIHVETGLLDEQGEARVRALF